MPLIIYRKENKRRLRQPLGGEDRCGGRNQKEAKALRSADGKGNQNIDIFHSRRTMSPWKAQCFSYNIFEYCGIKPKKQPSRFQFVPFRKSMTFAEVSCVQQAQTVQNEKPDLQLRVLPSGFRRRHETAKQTEQSGQLWTQSSSSVFLRFN